LCPEHLSFTSRAAIPNCRGQALHSLRIRYPGSMSEIEILQQLHDKPRCKLPAMWCFACVGCVLIANLVSPPIGLTQASGMSGSKTGVSVTKLAHPVYPRLAQQAHITGTVNIEVRVARDGIVQSATVISGHAMLRDSALQSARQSQFECERCSAEVSTYLLDYEFRLVAPDLTRDCTQWTDEELNAHSVKFDSAYNRVTVSAMEVWTCDPTVQLHKVRSAKCLYLWRCRVLR
jgi:TonB family protein